MSMTAADPMAIHRARRAALLERLGPSSVAVFASTPVAIRNADTEHPYRADSDLFYLTGLDEPDVLAVLSNTHAQHRFVLFVRPRDPERETWDGPRAGVEGAKALFGADEAYPIAELGQKLHAYFENARRVAYAAGRFPGNDERVFAALSLARRRQRFGHFVPSEIVEPAASLHAMRLVKQASELASMRTAIEATREGHANAMAVARPGAFEHDVEAELLRTFRRAGAERPAYEPIVGSGPNATILHYRKNDRRMEDGDLLLIDAGAEHGYYAADVTRTFPVNGRFTPAQRRIYDAVLASQLGAIAMTRPGATLEEIHGLVTRMLTESMLSLGLLKDMTVDQAIEKNEHKKFYPHRTSHWLGMDVHDVGPYFVDDGAGKPIPTRLGAGQVLTIEPGLYVPLNADVPPEYRGIGVRIEDDVLVTETGHEVMTRAIPKDATELEQILASRG